MPQNPLSRFSIFNVHGLKPNTVPSKVPFISDLLIEKNQLFMGITETWLHTHKDAELHIEGYKLFRSDRKRAKKTRGRYSGGVGCYVRLDIASSLEVLVTFSNGVVELLALYSRVHNLYIAVLYRQPDDPIGNNRSTEKEFQAAMDELKTSLSGLPTPAPNIFLCGDFNLPHSSWPDCSPTTGATTHEKEILLTLSDLKNRHFLTQHITIPTHIAGGSLDLLFCNNDAIIHSYDTLKPLQSTSDHYVLEINTHFHCNSQLKEEEKPERVSPLDNLNFHSNEIDWETLSAELKTHLDDANLEILPPNERLDQFMKILVDQAYKHVPAKRSARNGPLTKIPRERRILMRKRRKLTAKFGTATSEKSKTKVRDKLIQIEIMLQKSHQEGLKRREQLALKSIKTNPKYFFSYAKKFSTSHSKIGPLLNELNNYTNSSPEMAEILSSQYSSVFTKPSPSPYHDIEEDTDAPTITDIQFTEKDIVDAIDELSNTAASGPDGMAAIFLKKCKNSLCKTLFTLWRDCLDQGITPWKLKEGHIIPIHKGGHQGLAANYRPVALTSHLIKVFEKVVRNHLVKFLDTNDKFNLNQHGFRIGRSCLSQLLTHYDKIISILEKGLNVDTIYLDFAKAFDKVDHSLVLKKLSMLGIRGKILQWIESFLTNRTQRVMVNGFLSEPAPVISGVPQGSVIGPLLFLILIGDIDNDIATSFLSSFADDTRLSRATSGVTDCSALQTDLEKVYQWAIDNNMIFNAKKFEALRYGHDEVLKATTSYTSPDGSIIPSKDHLRDLGVTMSADGSFRKHISEMCQAARNMCSWILRTFHSRSAELMLTLWKSLVLPILDYCSQLWCPTKTGLIQEIEDIQKSFTRKIHFQNRGDYWERLSTLGLYSLQRRRERYRVIYTWKVLENLVPNVGANKIRSRSSLRHGRVCVVPRPQNTASCKVQGLVEASLVVHGGNLFNTLPKSIRNLTDVDLSTFKRRLDGYLSTVPDEPQSPGYTAHRRAASNSLIHMTGVC